MAAGKRPADKARQASGQLSGISRWNPFWIRIPLGKPDWLLAALNPLMGWLFTGTATLIALLLMMAAGLELATEWTRFASDSSQVFASGNWIWLLVAWLGLKLLHETAHGLVCRRYGGTVQDSGVILAFFAPLAYVDVTSSWAFRSRWQRIHTALAGMYIELVVASLAVFGWSWSTDAVWSSLFYNVILMAGLSTVLFNANPLMRFDGYYVLSDLLQIPNLYSQAGQAVQRLTERIVFGFRTAGPTTRHAAETVLQVYGFAALFWRILIMLSMLIAASMMLHGAGLVLTIAGVFAWCATPLWKLIVRLRQVAVESPARLIRAAVVTAGLSVAMVGGCLFVPAPFTTVAPAVVELPDGSLVRAAVDGFVQTVHVREGDRVDRGDLLLTLENRQVETEHRNLAVEIEQEQIRYQTAVRDHDADKAAIAQSNLRSLRQRLTETQERYDSLEIRASVSGTIVARTLASMPQTFVK
jgi:putative peptide zinc metalloprotease protein